MILKQPFHLFSKLTIFLIMFFYPKPHWMHLVFFIIQQIQNQFQITWLSDSQELVDIQSITPNQSLILSFCQRYSLSAHVVLAFTEPWFFRRPITNLTDKHFLLLYIWFHHNLFALSFLKLNTYINKSLNHISL